MFASSQTNQSTTVSAALTGIWLLSHQPNASLWDTIPLRAPDRFVYNLCWPAVATLPSIYQYQAGTAITDMVLLELAAGAEAISSSDFVLDAIRGLDTPAVQIVLTRFSQSPNPAFRTAGVAALLERGQLGAINMLKQLWPSISGDQKSKDLLISAVRDYFRNPDARVVAELVGLAEAAPSAEMRAAALAASAAIHTQETLPFLAGLLKSSDPGEQMRGVYGLGAFANGCPMQTRDNIKTLAYLQFTEPSPYRTSETIDNFAFRRGPVDQESKVISFWLSWWNSHPDLAR
jgi:hypothetical protein